MEKYIAPKIEIVKFETEDVISVSVNELIWDPIWQEEEGDE